MLMNLASALNQVAHLINSWVVFALLTLRQTRLLASSVGTGNPSTVHTGIVASDMGFWRYHIIHLAFSYDAKFVLILIYPIPVTITKSWHRMLYQFNWPSINHPLDLKLSIDYYPLY